MRPEIEPDGQKTRSFIEQARRAQIIASTIEVLAEVGFGKASLALIAQRAGISKGVISYHFAGKDELMEKVVEAVFTEIVELVGPQLEALTSGTELLRTQIRSVTAYMREHRPQLLAIGEVVRNLRRPGGEPRYGLADSDWLYEALEYIYRTGQASGEFRPFDTRVMAVTHQAAVDTMFAYWEAHPEHDLDAHAEALVEIFLRATRSDSPEGSPS